MGLEKGKYLRIRCEVLYIEEQIIRSSFPELVKSKYFFSAPLIQSSKGEFRVIIRPDNDYVKGEVHGRVPFYEGYLKCGEDGVAEFVITGYSIEPIVYDRVLEIEKEFISEIFQKQKPNSLEYNEDDSYDYYVENETSVEIDEELSKKNIVADDYFGKEWCEETKKQLQLMKPENIEDLKKWSKMLDFFETVLESKKKERYFIKELKIEKLYRIGKRLFDKNKKEYIQYIYNKDINRNGAVYLIEKVKDSEEIYIALFESGPVQEEGGAEENSIESYESSPIKLDNKSIKTGSKCQSNNDFVKEIKKFSKDSVAIAFEKKGKSYQYFRQLSLGKYITCIEEKNDQQEKKAPIKNETDLNLLQLNTNTFYFEVDKRFVEKFKKVEDNAKGSQLFLIYDDIKERKKLERLRDSFKKFISELRYEYKPSLSHYLSLPEKLKKFEVEEIKEWFSKKLNENQKIAVQKAVSSNILFLIQGPPGTGKTEVITEIAAQLAKRGKKVLISSETHKAIDNVFERLPKTPFVVPLRLIPNADGIDRKTEYGPSNLIKNIYSSIRERIQHLPDKHKNFYEKMNNYESKKERLDKEYSDLLNKKKDFFDEIEKNKEIADKVKQLKKDNENNREKNLLLQDQVHDEENRLEKIKNFIFFEDGDELLKELCEKITKLFEKKDYSNFKKENMRLILQTTEDAIKQEFDDFEKISFIGDYLKQEEESNDIKEINLIQIFNNEALRDINTKLTQKKLLDDFKRFKDEIEEVVNEYKKVIEDAKRDLENRLRKMEENIDKNSNEIRSLERDKTNNEEIEDYNKKEEEFNDKLNSFILEYDIPFNNIKSISSIKNAIDDFSQNLEEAIEKNKDIQRRKKRIAEDISKYLEREEIVKNDSKLFNEGIVKSLANVIGITSSSRTWFKQGTIEDCNFEIVVEWLGIDVVIIDEVSKSSFIDLLVPILYGNKVILVGDHKQLPPIYPYKYIKEDDFSKIISAGSTVHAFSLKDNKDFQELYERSFFKDLFEKVEEDHKAMLNEQYRSHSDIMDVYNHFYDDKLISGADNKAKEHELKISSKDGKQFITPDRHAYFINCSEKEKRNENSTSIFNEGEADMVAYLIEAINKENIRLEKEEKEKKSVGVICMYGDQVREVKDRVEKLNNKLENDKVKEKKKEDSSKEGKDKKEKQEDELEIVEKEKFIVSTVDDFQGDERDIIIVSMVRNPIDPKRAKNDFIEQKERINVALSRARYLLIIVGSKEYLARSPEFSKIIHTIGEKGRILEAKDILENFDRGV